MVQPAEDTPGSTAVCVRVYNTKWMATLATKLPDNVVQLELMLPAEEAEYTSVPPPPFVNCDRTEDILNNVSDAAVDIDQAKQEFFSLFPIQTEDDLEKLGEL